MLQAVALNFDVARRALLLLGALLAGGAVAMAASTVSLSPASAPGKALGEYLGERKGSSGAVDDLGNAIIRRMPSLLRYIDGRRRWIRLAGGDVSPARIAGMAGLLGGLGFLLGVVTGVPAASIAGLLGAAYPFMQIRSRANAVRRKVQRSLPELAALMAAEMAAGNSPDQALERAAEWGGPLAAIIREAMAEGKASGRPLFGRQGMPGALMDTVRGYDLPALKAFASQMDMAAQKGAAGPEMMGRLAKTLVVEYKDRALRRAEKLDDDLALPSVLFFFLPFLFLMLTPLLVPLIQMM